MPSACSTAGCSCATCSPRPTGSDPLVSAVAAKITKSDRPQSFLLRRCQFAEGSNQATALRRSAAAFQTPAWLRKRRGIVPADLLPRLDLSQRIKHRLPRHEADLRFAGMIEAIIDLFAVGAEPEVPADLHGEMMRLQFVRVQQLAAADGNTGAPGDWFQGEDATALVCGMPDFQARVMRGLHGFSDRLIWFVSIKSHTGRVGQWAASGTGVGTDGPPPQVLYLLVLASLPRRVRATLPRNLRAFFGFRPK